MKTPILLVAFGALSSAARDTYARFEKDVRTAHPEHEVHWAFTATSLIARMKQHGETAQIQPLALALAQPLTLAEAYAALRHQGFDSVAVQSLHLVPGEKHEGILSENPQGLRVAFGSPLLSTQIDIEEVAAGLLSDLPKDCPVLIVAHGHAQEAHYNAQLMALGDQIMNVRPDVFLTRLEGDTNADGMDRFISLARKSGKVHITPFLLVAGDHVASDILGDDPESLRSRLSVPDFTCGEALGQRSWVRKRFLANLDKALSELEEA